MECFCKLCQFVVDLSGQTESVLLYDWEILHLIKYCKNAKVCTRSGKQKEKRSFIVAKKTESATNRRVLEFLYKKTPSDSSITGKRNRSTTDFHGIGLIAHINPDDRRYAIIDFEENTEAIQTIRTFLKEKIIDDDFSPQNVFDKSLDYFTGNTPPSKKKKLDAIKFPRIVQYPRGTHHNFQLKQELPLVDDGDLQVLQEDIWVDNLENYCVDESFYELPESA